MPDIQKPDPSALPDSVPSTPERAANEDDDAPLFCEETGSYCDREGCEEGICERAMGLHEDEWDEF